MKKLSFLCFAILLLFALHGCGQETTWQSEFTDRGVLRVGVKVDVPGFGCLNPETGAIEGLEVDLARLIAEDLLGDSEAVELIGVTAQMRGTMLDNDELDLVIATFTITEERKALFHFTEPYYHDEIGFLVRKDAGFSGITDLNGKTMGTVQSSTTRDALDQEAATLDIAFSHREYASYPELKAALLASEIDAFSVDKSILLGYVDAETEILGDGFNPQEYGIASRLDHEEFNLYLDEWLEALRADGTLDELIARWGQSASQ